MNKFTTGTPMPSWASALLFAFIIGSGAAVAYLAPLYFKSNTKIGAAAGREGRSGLGGLASPAVLLPMCVCMSPAPL